MPNTIQKTMEASIAKHFEELMDNRIKHLKTLAFWDLHFGPLQGCDVCGVDYTRDCTCDVKWEGFEKATQKLSDWARDNLPSQLWYDAGCDCIAESEPEVDPCYECDGKGEGVEGKCQVCNGYGFTDPYTEETYQLNRSEIKRYVFGKELSQYV